MNKSRIITFVAGVLAFAGLTAFAIHKRNELPPLPPAAAPAATVATPATPPAVAEEHVHNFQRIALSDVSERIRRGEVLVLDVREAEAYLQSHIPGSLHIPIPYIEGELNWLRQGKPIVTYCTCPAEETSGHAAQLLSDNGVEAYALVGGLDAWKNAGLPVKAGREP